MFKFGDVVKLTDEALAKDRDFREWYSGMRFVIIREIPDAVIQVSQQDGQIQVFNKDELELANSIPELDIPTHSSHCCPTHGCKYGNDEYCPINLGLNPPKYPPNNGCDVCYDEELGAQSTEKVGTNYTIHETIDQRAGMFVTKWKMTSDLPGAGFQPLNYGSFNTLIQAREYAHKQEDVASITVHYADGKSSVLSRSEPEQIPGFSHVCPVHYASYESDDCTLGCPGAKEYYARKGQDVMLEGTTETKDVSTTSQIITIIDSSGSMDKHIDEAVKNAPGPIYMLNGTGKTYYAHKNEVGKVKLGGEYKGGFFKGVEEILKDNLTAIFNIHCDADSAYRKPDTGPGAYRDGKKVAEFVPGVLTQEELISTLESKYPDIKELVSYTEIHLSAYVDEETGEVRVYDGNTQKELLQGDEFNDGIPSYTITMRVPTDKLNDTKPKPHNPIIEM